MIKQYNNFMERVEAEIENSKQPMLYGIYQDRVY